jgi:putative heme-binding domain-containing protein
MAKFGRDRMPHIGSERPDETGLELIAQWIAGIQNGGERTDRGSESGAPEALLASPRSAMVLARRLGRGELDAAGRNALIAAAARLPTGPIRDLFEGYLPSGKQGKGKLGSSPRPKAVLAKSGDSNRGEQLFWSQPVQCGRCHRIGDRGTPVGPDLSTIGRIRSRGDLLESLLEPSRRIEPKYATYAIATTDGASLAGVLVKRDERSVVLRDAQGKEIVLAAKDVEELRPSRASLMPEGQLADLTAQDAADLVEYLASLK